MKSMGEVDFSTAVPTKAFAKTGGRGLPALFMWCSLYRIGNTHVLCAQSAQSTRHRQYIQYWRMQIGETRNDEHTSTDMLRYIILSNCNAEKSRDSFPLPIPLPSLFYLWSDTSCFQLLVLAIYIVCGLIMITIILYPWRFMQIPTPPLDERANSPQLPGQVQPNYHD